MCDTPSDAGRAGWGGWPALPPGRNLRPAGDWIDLTHGFGEAVPRSAMFPPPAISPVHQMPQAPLNVSRLDTIVHIGTHVDAPRHFFADGPGMDEVPLDLLTGPGVVLEIGKPEFSEITADDLESAGPQVWEGDILAVCMGWSARWGTPAWARHPHFSADAAEWMIARRIRMLAVDTATPDMAFDARGPDFDYPVHRALLGRGILIAEQVAHLDALAGMRLEFLFCPIPIVGCDGAPARVLARRLGV